MSLQPKRSHDKCNQHRWTLSELNIAAASLSITYTLDNLVLQFIIHNFLILSALRCNGISCQGHAARQDIILFIIHGACRLPRHPILRPTSSSPSIIEVRGPVRHAHCVDARDEGMCAMSGDDSAVRASGGPGGGTPPRRGVPCAGYLSRRGQVFANSGCVGAPPFCRKPEE